MTSEMFSESGPYGCIKNFNCLNGRRKQEVVIGDNPDARVARFFCRTFVKHNWPSQWHTKYKEGYIEFANGKRFDLASHTIEEKPAYIFLYSSREIEILYRKQIAKSMILDYAATTTPARLETCAGLVVELAGSISKLPIYFIGLNEIAALLDALSLRDLEGLAAELTLRGSGEGSVQSSKAVGRPGEICRLGPM